MMKYFKKEDKKIESRVIELKEGDKIRVIGKYKVGQLVAYRERVFNNHLGQMCHGDGYETMTTYSKIIEVSGSIYERDTVGVRYYMENRKSVRSEDILRIEKDVVEEISEDGVDT